MRSSLMVEKPSNKGNDIDDNLGMAADESMIISQEDWTPIMVKENYMDI